MNEYIAQLKKQFEQHYNEVNSPKILIYSLTIFYAIVIKRNFHSKDSWISLTRIFQNQ